MRKPSLAAEVRGSHEFARFYSALKPKDPMRKAVDEALNALKSDATAGIKVQRRLWPKYYVQKFGLSNLFKLDLIGGCRLTYTILSERGGLVVIALELLSHKEYERRFGYGM